MSDDMADRFNQRHESTRSSAPPPAVPSSADEWQRFVAGQLQQQTKALLTIKTVMVTWMVLTVIGAVLLVAGQN